MRPRISCRWRRGVVPTAILSGPIHILRKRDSERAVGGRGGRKWFPPRTGERQNMLLARQEAARGGRRTVPVAFESCRANASISSLVSLFSERQGRFFPQSVIARALLRKSDLIGRCRDVKYEFENDAIVEISPLNVTYTLIYKI